MFNTYKTERDQGQWVPKAVMLFPKSAEVKIYMVLPHWMCLRTQKSVAYILSGVADGIAFLNKLNTLLKELCSSEVINVASQYHQLAKAIHCVLMLMW